MPARIRSRNGFTLLEIIITIVILSVGLLVLSQAFSTGMLASTDAENVDLALNIAQAEMEEIRNTSFSGIGSSEPTSDPNFPNFTTTVTVTGTDPKEVNVSVAWNVQAGSTSISLTTFIANCSCY